MILLNDLCPILNTLLFFLKFSEKPKQPYSEMIPAPIDRVNRLLRAKAVAAPHLMEDASTQLIFLIAGSACEMDSSLTAGKQKTDQCQDNTAKLAVSATHSFFLNFGKQTHGWYFYYSCSRSFPFSSMLPEHFSLKCSCSNRCWCCGAFGGFEPSSSSRRWLHSTRHKHIQPFFPFPYDPDW